MDVYKTDLFFLKHELAVEADENGQKDRNEHKENERENAIKNILVVSLFRINPN